MPSTPLPSLRKRSAVVFDVDGVLCENKDYFHYAEAGGWDEFHKHLIEMPPIPEYVALAELLSQAGHHLVALTCRPDTFAGPTRIWIRTHVPHIDQVIIRPVDAPQEGFKGTVVASLMERYHVALAFEDNRKYMAEIEALGVPVIYVHSGYYQLDLKVAERDA
jgi:hypothetical protein